MNTPRRTLFVAFGPARLMLAAMAPALHSFRGDADTRAVLTPRAIGVLSAGVGACLELGIHFATGRREAWDSNLYWTVGLPAAAAASLVLGVLARGRAWIWTLLVAPGQVLTMMVRSLEFGTLWPLTLALSAVLSVPFLFAAFVGSRLRRAVVSKAA